MGENFKTQAKAITFEIGPPLDIISRSNKCECIKLESFCITEEIIKRRDWEFISYSLTKD